LRPAWLHAAEGGASCPRLDGVPPRPNYEGVPLEEPGRRIKAKRAKVKRRKAPTLPPELHFLSPAGVREWKKAAKRAPLARNGDRSSITPRWCDVVEVVETKDGPARSTVMASALVWNRLGYYQQPKKIKIWRKRRKPWSKTNRLERRRQER
jgi:hypothetical protein